ncbi:unnamed protein product, partial [Prorocentrum cordatum]
AILAQAVWDRGGNRATGHRGLVESAGASAHDAGAVLPRRARGGRGPVPDRSGGRRAAGLAGVGGAVRPPAVRLPLRHHDVPAVRERALPPARGRLGQRAPPVFRLPLRVPAEAPPRRRRHGAAEVLGRLLRLRRRGAGVPLRRPVPVRPHARGGHLPRRQVQDRALWRPRLPRRGRLLLRPRRGRAPHHGARALLLLERLRRRRLRRGGRPVVRGHVDVRPRHRGGGRPAAAGGGRRARGGRRELLPPGRGGVQAPLLRLLPARGQLPPRGHLRLRPHREEIRLPLLAPEEEDQRPAALSNDFFMLRFKTHWCPIGVQHDWQTCVYAHNYQDARRHPAIGYGPRPCPHWKRQEASLEYSRRCPLGVRCPFSHGAKEQLYHPDSFKTVTCQDSQSTSCPRGKLCAFWHNRSQQRLRSSAKSEYNYKAPLGEEKVCAHLQQDFLTPPFKLLNSLQASMQTMECDVLLDALQPDEMMCGLCDGPQDVVLQDWSLQVCGPGGAATPTTQATQSPATDSDEAGSAVGSDKPIPVQDEDGLDAVVFGSISEADLAMAAPHEAQSHAWQLQGGSPGDCDPSGAVMGQPWGTQVCFGETLVVPAYIPSSSDSGEPTQMLFYMPLPPQMPQMAMVPVAVPMPAPGPEVTYEVMVPVSAAGEALPLEGACATPHFEEAPAPAHHGFLAAAGAGGAMTTQGAGVTPQFEEAPAPEHCGLVPAAEGAAEAATGSGGGGDDDGECESPAYRRPRALSH